MHEYSIAQALFDQIDNVARRNHATAVRLVRISLGESCGVDASLLRTAYETCRVRTICESAPLEVDTIPVRWICPEGHGELLAGRRLACETCGRPARLVSGDEITLERLELEVA